MWRSKAREGHCRNFPSHFGMGVQFQSLSRSKLAGNFHGQSPLKTLDPSTMSQHFFAEIDR
jgi:hypothetical protein